MAILGKWSGDTVSVLPGTSYAAPAALFPTEDRNDGSAYSWNSATSTLTLPATDLADGYLLVGAVDLVDTSNGRCNILSKITRASGTGDFLSLGRKSGYCRDSNDDHAYSRCVSFVNNPSAGATFQYTWRRDSDAPTGGTGRSEFQVIPLYYSQWGGWSSTSNAAAGGTTPTILPGFTEVGSSGANISFASNVATIKGFGKRYLAIGGWNFLGMGNARTQRWGGFREDGTLDDSSKSHGFSRNNANDLMAGIVSNIYLRLLSNVDIDLAVYRGNGVASGEGGAEVDSNTTAASGAHGFIILELDDGCSVFRTKGSTNQNIATTGPIDLAVSKVADVESFTDAAAFVRSTDTGMNVERDMDLLFGANVSAASQTTADSRFTGYAELTVDGVEVTDSFDGGYLRGASIGEGTFGWSANLLGFQAISADEDIGVSGTELVGSAGGAGSVHVQAGWLGFWGLDLDTMQPGITGSGAGDLPTLEGDGAGGQRFTGSGAGVLPALEGDGAGLAGKITGSGSGDLPTLGGDGAGGQLITGAGAGVLPVLEGDGQGTTRITGAGAGGLPVLDGDGQGVAGRITGSGAGDLPTLEGDGAGSSSGITGSGAGVLPVLDGVGAGGQRFTGSGAGLLPALTGDGLGGQEIITGSGAGDLPTLEGDGQGVAGRIIGSGAGILPVLEGSSGSTPVLRSTRVALQLIVQNPLNPDPGALLLRTRQGVQVLALVDTVRGARSTRLGVQVLVQTIPYALLGGSGAQVLVGALGVGSPAGVRRTRGGVQVVAVKTPPPVTGDVLLTRGALQVIARRVPSSFVDSSSFGANPPAILKHDYSFATTTSSRWETAVSASVESIAEERVAQIGRRPTLTVGATLTGLTDIMVSHIQGYLRERAGGNGLSPLYSDRTELTADAVASTIIECDTRWRRLFVGQLVFVTPPTFDSKTVVGSGEAGIVVRVEADRLILSSTITAPAGSFVYPMIDTGSVGQSSDSIDTTRFTRAKIEFTELPGASSLPSTSERIPPGVDVFDGHPILPGCIDWTNPIPQRVHLTGEQYRIGNALITVQRGERPIVVTQLRIVAMSREDAWRTVQTFDYCKGRLLPFWVISPTNFVRITQAITSTLLEIETDHTIDFLQRHVKAVGIGYSDSSMKLANVVSITEVLGVQQIRLDRSIDITGIVFIEPAYLSRSAFDVLTEEWLTLEHMVTTITTTDLLDEREIPLISSGIE